MLYFGVFLLMVENRLRLLAVGYSDLNSDTLYSELISVVDSLQFERADNALDMHAALCATEWDAIICNDTCTSHCQNTLNLIKDSGRDIPFIIYAHEPNDQIFTSIVGSDIDDFVPLGNIPRLLFAIEREKKNVLTRRKKLDVESQMYRLTNYDELTGLPKRNLFCEQVSEMLSKQDHSTAFAAIYFVTFHRLPYINGTYGYHIGDMLIQQLSCRLTVETGKNCLLTHIEGSKFAYFNNNVTNIEDVQYFANQITQLISAPFVINNLEFFVTSSIGVCVYPTDGNDIALLLANAENTLSMSTDTWCNRCKYYIKAVEEVSTKRLALENSLRKAINNEEFVLLFQPIVDLKMGDIIGAEALIRWNHPKFGLLCPDSFIPLAHETALIVEIGKWVLYQACKQTKAWHDAGYCDLSIAINISAIELDQSQLLVHLSKIIEKTGLYPGAVELEIKESVLMQDAEISIKTLQALKEIGVKIAVDDFGTGYSSLNCLKRLPVDILKIDKSLTNDVGQDLDSATIITTIVGLAHNLGLTSLAEGVETKEQFDFLHDAQCDRAQGYLFSKPISSEDLFYLLEQKKTGTLA